MEESLLLEVGHGGRHLYMMVLSNKALNGLHHADPHVKVSSVCGIRTSKLAEHIRLWRDWRAAYISLRLRLSRLISIDRAYTRYTCSPSLHVLSLLLKVIDVHRD